MFCRLVGGQRFLRPDMGRRGVGSLVGFEDGAAEAVVCFIYSDGVEWDGDDTLVQGFTVLFTVGLRKFQCIFLRLFMTRRCRTMCTSKSRC